MAKEIYKKLSEVQAELKAPKGQYNSFGKYNYRSCEDILEAVKPILKKHGLVLFLDDSLETQGHRYYIQANAHLVDIESGDDLSVSAYAREAAQKKGMDDSQTTGCASSYARKYALNGLFCIDDTKDADTDEYRNTQKHAQSAHKGRNDSSKGNYTKAAAQTAKSAPSATEGQKTLNATYDAFVEKYAEKYEKAVECLEEGFEDSIQYYGFSKIDSRKISSTNTLERLNKEVRRRSRVVGIFPSKEYNSGDGCH